MSRYVIRRPLTRELGLKNSPVRRFFDDRFAAGLKQAQAAYRSGAPGGPALVPGVPREQADPGTTGAAADWMMRFLVHPAPSLELAACGASLCGMRPVLEEIASLLGISGGGTGEFAGPGPGSAAEPGLLYRACWGLALLTEVYRAGPAVAELGPLGRLPDKSARSLLAAAPDAGLQQLAALREVMQARLLPALSGRRGRWAAGPAFAGSSIMPGDADLVAAGLLVELKATSKKPSLAVTDLWQVLGYALMDYTDEFAITDVALFSARYGYLAQWDLGSLLKQLAQGPVTLPALRAEFRQMLESCRAHP